jgi:uncharacterized protein YprB with RNaseH-like and TPR domain
VITRENKIKLGEIISDFSLSFENNKELYKEALFFDLEHYVYKKPICVGVFGCSYYDEAENCLNVTQYMIENQKDSREILNMAIEYFNKMKQELGKKYIVTFSGNNDYTMINYLFNKYKLNYKVEEQFIGIDLQKEYEKVKKTSIGLKALEKNFDIIREGELISGATLAKTFNKIMKDDDYMNRMPDEKKEKILLYNEQDVVNLFHIYVNWEKAIALEVENPEINENEKIDEAVE